MGESFQSIDSDLHEGCRKLILTLKETIRDLRQSNADLIRAVSAIKNDVFKNDSESLTKYVRALQQSIQGPLPDGNIVSKQKRSHVLDDVPAGSEKPIRIKGDFISRVQYDNLVRKYDLLISEKEAAEMKYMKDYKKWKEFKSWLFSTSKRGKALQAYVPRSPTTLDSTKETKQGIIGSLTEKPSLDSISLRMLEPVHRSEDKFRRKKALTDEVPQLAGRGDIWMAGRAAQEEERFVPRKSIPSRSKVLASRSASPPAAMHREIKDNEGSAQKTEFPNPTRTPKAPARKSVKGEERLSINALFEIDQTRNDGVKFQFDETLRGRETRQRLHAGQCDCCKDYYEHVNPLPHRSGPPVWKSPEVSRVIDDSPSLDTEQHKQRISRHRHKWGPPTTPPGYWNIGFPTTQEVAEINKRAEDMHTDKRRRIEAEASRAGGRYKRRADA